VCGLHQQEQLKYSIWLLVVEVLEVLVLVNMAVEVAAVRVVSALAQDYL
jgi:hypothetical protein